MEDKIVKKGILERLWVGTNVLNAFGILGVVGLMVLPVPPMMLDILLTFNITFGLVILLVTIYVKEPLDFSVFPSLLLIVTLFRLALNVASTRLILSQGYAGEVISSFGNFVVRGNYVIGLVIFLILVVIQFVVITKGAGRIAEVAARFTLDAMPGKQMSIDADLNAGLITESEAKARRSKISRESDFYGAMDGASKFVRGDAIAGIVITLINIIGGLVIGIVQRKMTAGEAAMTYTMLTVSDGLVTQLPALIISTGFMTMRALEAVETLEADRVDVGVLHVPTIKPLDEATILREASRTGRMVVVAENHTVVGGLGEAVAGLLLRAGVTPKFGQVGLPDEFLDAGALPTLHERYGISANAMSRQIKKWLSH